jgi:NADH-quinone oxidoreductase subunit A
MPDLVYYLLVFLAVGSFFLFIHLYMGHFIRPNKPEPDKLTIYECGEPTVGSAWVQFDLRYYVVALLFVVFDVEVAFFFPWAVVFGTALDAAHEPDAAARTALMQTLEPSPALPALPGQENPGTISQETAKSWAWVAFCDILVFFGVLMVGFAYLWRRGDLDWVRTINTAQQAQPDVVPKSRDWSEKATVGAGS